MIVETCLTHKSHILTTPYPLSNVVLPNRLWRNVQGLSVADVLNRYAVGPPGSQEKYLKAFTENRQIVQALGEAPGGILGNTFAVFMKAIKEIPFYPTAWGLCGLTAIEAAWCATYPDHTKTLQDPNKLVLKFRDDFDKAEITAFLHPYSKKIKTPIRIYKEEHSGKDFLFVEKGVDKKTLLETYRGLMWNNKLLVPIVLNFPDHEEKYTHWFYIDCIDESRNMALIVGDLLPFGIANSYGLYVDLDAFCNAVSDVLNFQSTDRGSHLKKSQDRHNQGFKYNSMSVTFFNP